MYRAGEFVATHIDGLRDKDEQTQPNGVDLTVETIYEQVQAGEITKNGKDVGGRIEMDEDHGQYDAEDEMFELLPGEYIIEYSETINVPENHIGFVYPRSTILRNSCMINTAVWDAGYSGRGEGLLTVYHPIHIEKGSRIAQFVLSEAETEGTYDGDYQNENLN